MKLLLSALFLVAPLAHAGSQDMLSRRLDQKFSAATLHRNEARMMRKFKIEVAREYGPKVAGDLTAFVKSNGSNGRVCNDQKLITYVVGKKYVCKVFHVVPVCDYEYNFSSLALEGCILRD